MVTIRTWAEAHAYLGSKSDRPLTGRATRIQRRDNNEIAIHYQNTDVVTYRLNGTCVLNSDGWQTPTTKERMNTYSPACIYQHKSVWYMHVIGEPWPSDGGSDSEFYDGVWIDAAGRPGIAKFGDDANRRKIDRAVAKFIKGYRAELDAGRIAIPDNGDCWGCRFGMENGTYPMGYSHFLDHFTEPYYVPSILYRAIVSRWNGDSSAASTSLSLAFHSPQWANMAERALRSYFKKIKPELYKLA